MAALFGQNPQAAVTAAANEYLNNCAAGDDACKHLAAGLARDADQEVVPMAHAQ